MEILLCFALDLRSCAGFSQMIDHQEGNELLHTFLSACQEKYKKFNFEEDELALNKSDSEEIMKPSTG